MKVHTGTTLNADSQWELCCSVSGVKNYSLFDWREEQDVWLMHYLEAEGDNKKKLFKLDTTSFEQVTKSFKHDNSKNLCFFCFFALGFRAFVPFGVIMLCLFSISSSSSVFHLPQSGFGNVVKVFHRYSCVLRRPVDPLTWAWSLDMLLWPKHPWSCKSACHVALTVSSLQLRLLLSYHCRDSFFSSDTDKDSRAFLKRDGGGIFSSHRLHFFL